MSQITTKHNYSQIKVSVIVPTIGRPTLEETLKSVLSQTYSNIEIIVTDDNSNGVAYEIVKKFNTNKIKYVKNKKYKKGPSGNKNNGLDYMTGDYFTFIDDDDLLVPESIKTFVDIASLGYDVVIANCLNSLTGTFTGISPGKDIEFTYEDFLRGFLDGEYIIFSKSSLVGNERFYDDCWGGEHLLWWKILKKMKKGYYIDKPLRIYNVQTPDRVTFQMEKYPERQMLSYYYTIIEFGADLLNISPNKQFIRYLLRGIYFSKLANDTKMLKFFRKSIDKVPNISLKILSLIYYFIVKYSSKTNLIKFNSFLYKILIPKIKAWFKQI
ncbi:GalNAc(5)-diNAcBac-PP-undecaprenol beta-1,3-glucosyltransferase [bacterium HR19]|nr:GalNAc(5)-diNAcBac-PP-undecaprenol beta-1,3-glucosyltransferase [bacterium HR19]